MRNHRRIEFGREVAPQLPLRFFFFFFYQHVSKTESYFENKILAKRFKNAKPSQNVWRVSVLLCIYELIVLRFLG